MRWKLDLICEIDLQTLNPNISIFTKEITQLYS